MSLYQPTIIAPSSLNGTGVIDATQDLKVTWIINGTVPIVGWRIIIMENTTESTVLYDSDWRHEYYPAVDPLPPMIKPVYGRDIEGNPVPKTDTVTAADLAQAGVVNNFGKGYKIRVDEQYDVFENPNTSAVPTRKVLTQISPTFFSAMESASFNTSNWLSAFGRFAYFYDDVNPTSINISHDLFDPLVMARWRFATRDAPDEHILEDTGNVYNTMGVMNKVYGILKNGGEYAVRLTGQLQSGIELDTGWHNFSASWTDTAESYIHLVPYYVLGQPCVFIRFEADEGHDLSSITSAAENRGWEVYRVRTDTGEMEKAGVIPRGQIAMYDFGARNNTEYIYRAYYGLGAENGYCYETERSIKMRYYWNWAILECEKKETRYQYLPGHTYTNAMYHVKRVFQFQGNVSSGQVSNDNDPMVEDNFTPYPTVQKSTRIGLSGTLKAVVGKTRNGVFKDSIREIDTLMELGTRETVKFLRDRKGNIRRIDVSGAIKKTTGDTYAEQPVEAEVPWVEVADAKDAQIVSMITDGLITPGDDIVDTTTAITTTPKGYIRWTIADDENYLGSEVYMNDDGYLVQKYSEDMTYSPAELEIVDGELKGTTPLDAEE